MEGGGGGSRVEWGSETHFGSGIFSPAAPEDEALLRACVHNLSNPSERVLKTQKEIAQALLDVPGKFHVFH